MKKLLILVLLFTSGCYGFANAVTKLERHTSSAYENALSSEKGFKSKYDKSYDVPQDYEHAYFMYLVADRLGDVRAKEKILSLSAKIVPEKRQEIESKVASLSTWYLRNYSHVPPEYDTNSPSFNPNWRSTMQNK